MAFLLENRSMSKCIERYLKKKIFFNDKYDIRVTYLYGNNRFAKFYVVWENQKRKKTDVLHNRKFNF